MCSLRNRCARQLRTAKRLLQCYSLFLFLYWNQVELSRPFRFWFFGQIPCLWFFFFFFYIYSTMNHPPLWIQEEAFIIVIHQMNDVNYVAIEDSCVFVKNLFVLNPRNTKTHDVNKNMITCKEGIKVRKGLFLLLLFNACWCLFFSSLKYLINFVMFWK